jgi:hypothetical protein
MDKFLLTYEEFDVKHKIGKLLDRRYLQSYYQQKYGQVIWDYDNAQCYKPAAVVYAYSENLNQVVVEGPNAPLTIKEFIIQAIKCASTEDGVLGIIHNNEICSIARKFKGEILYLFN